MTVCQTHCKNGSFVYVPTIFYATECLVYEVMQGFGHQLTQPWGWPSFSNLGGACFPGLQIPVRLAMSTREFA